MQSTDLPTLSACLAASGPLEQAKFWISVAGLVSAVGILAAHYIAVGYMNLFEEAYRYHQAKMFLFFLPVLPNAFWNSIENSMKKQLRQFKYLRTYWQEERSSFSGDFNHYIQFWVRPFD